MGEAREKQKNHILYTRSIWELFFRSYKILTEDIYGMATMAHFDWIGTMWLFINTQKLKGVGWSEV